MGQLHIEGLADSTHHCTSHREGDWIIWRCPHCADYERRFNWQTGQMKVERGNSAAQHTGINSQGQNMAPLAKLIPEQSN